MDIHIKIEKKHFYIFLFVGLVIGLITIVNAYLTGQPASKVGHDYGELESVQRVISGSCTSNVMVGVDANGNVICEGDDGITSENDPTVIASVKDGVSWSEIFSIPAGFADGVDNGITSENDPRVGAIELNKWCIGDGIHVQCNQNPPGGVDTRCDTQNTCTNVYATETLFGQNLKDQVDDNIVSYSNLQIGTNTLSRNLDVRGEFSCPSCIGSVDILDGSITSDDLGVDSVGVTEIIANSVGESEIAQNIYVKSYYFTIGSSAYTSCLTGDVALADVFMPQPSSDPDIYLRLCGTRNT